MFDRLRRAAALAAVLALSALPAGAQEAGGQDPVVAVVNGSEIRLSDVIDARSGLPEQYRTLPLQAMFPSLIERLIDFELVIGEGRRVNLQDDEVVKRRVAQIEDNVIYDVFLSRYVEGAVTDEVLRGRYEEFKADSPPREEVHARHILVETEEDAVALIERIAGGADFIEVAKEKSTGPSASSGGDLGYFTRDQMVPEFADAAFALQAGEMTDAPVKSPFGWHVIRVEDRRTAPPPSFEEVRQQLASEVSQQAVAALVETLRGTATVVRFNIDGSPVTETPPEPEAQPPAPAP